MTWPVDVAGLKAQLRLGAGDTLDDDLLATMLAAATRGCFLHLDRPINDSTLTEADYDVIGQAILVWATALFEDREGAGDTPAAVAALLRPLRSLAR